MEETPVAKRVFISYSWRDKGFVTGVCESVRLLEVPIWFDRLEIDARGHQYTEAELQAIVRSSLNRCSAVVVLLNEYALDSAWIAFEIEVARQVKLQRPEFQIVGLLTQPLPAAAVNEILAEATILDFSSGYKTALGRLGHALSHEFTVSSGRSVDAALTFATRNLDRGIQFNDFMRSLGIEGERLNRLQAARNSYARLSALPGVETIAGLDSETDDQYSTSISCLPAAVAVQSSRSADTAVELVLHSIWPSGEARDDSNTSTLIIAFNQDGSCVLSLAHQGHMHRFSMGGMTAPSILLSENFEMGDRACALRWPNNNPDARLLYYRQALANKLGLGDVRLGQEFGQPVGVGVAGVSAYYLWSMVKLLAPSAVPAQPVEPRAWAAGLWLSLVDDHWQQLEVSQASAVMGFIKLGGILLYEVSPQSSVSPALAQQLRQVILCAGGEVFEMEVDAQTRQFVCASPRWVGLVSEHVNASEAAPTRSTPVQQDEKISAVEPGRTPVNEHAALLSFPAELQQLCALLPALRDALKFGGAENSSLQRWPDSVWQAVIARLASFAWVHGIWLHGMSHMRVVGNGSIDLIVNPDLGGPDSYTANHYGLLVSAHRRGELFLPAKHILFTVFLFNAGRTTYHVATGGQLHRYEFEGRGNLVLTASGDIGARDVISFGDRFPWDIPDAVIRTHCLALQDEMNLVNMGLAGNFVDFLMGGGIFVYADYPGSHFHHALNHLTEIKPLAHLAYCGNGSAKAAGGEDLPGLPVRDATQRINAFFYSRAFGEKMDRVVNNWTPKTQSGVQSGTVS